MRTFKIQSIIAFLLSFIVPCQVQVVWSSDIRTQQSNLFPYRSVSFYQDDFNTGTTTNGNIGSIGWQAVGTITNLASEINRPGIIRFDTGAVLGTAARVHFSSSSAFEGSLPHIINLAVRLNTNDANTTTRIGSSSSVGANPPTGGIYIEKLDTDTNWFCITRSAAVQTRTDSGIAVSTSFITSSYRRTSSNVQFFINNTLVCTHTTNVPTTFLSPIVYIINSAAAAKTFDIDYADIQIYGLSR